MKILMRLPWAPTSSKANSNPRVCTEQSDFVGLRLCPRGAPKAALDGYVFGDWVASTRNDTDHDANDDAPTQPRTTEPRLYEMTSGVVMELRRLQGCRLSRPPHAVQQIPQAPIRWREMLSRNAPA